MKSREKTMYLIKEWIIPIIIAFIMYKLITNYVFFNSKIPSLSMYPTLQVNDRLFTSRLFNVDKLERGDIVVFKNPQEGSELYIKRIIGLPGDNIDLKPNGEIYINNQLLEEPYVTNQISSEEYEKGLYGGMELKEYIVPEGKVFLLGDNRVNSRDSRYWKDSFISKENIIGLPIIRIWPIQRIGKIQ